MLQTITNGINLKKEFVSKCFPSLFTKEDVIALLNELASELEYEINSVGPDDEKKYTLEEINRSFHNMHVDGDCFEVDYDSARFEIDYHNKLKLEDVEVNLETENLFKNFKKALTNDTEN